MHLRHAGPSVCVGAERTCEVCSLFSLSHSPFYERRGHAAQDAKAFFAQELGEPFAPFEQLMSVLPAASKHALPPCLQALMRSVKR